jgi:hypothetical protein
MAGHFERLIARRFDEGGPLLAAKIDDEGGTAQTPRALIRQRFMRGLRTGRASALDGSA